LPRKGAKLRWYCYTERQLSGKVFGGKKVGLSIRRDEGRVRFVMRREARSRAFKKNARRAMGKIISCLDLGSYKVLIEILLKKKTLGHRSSKRV